MTNYPFDDDRPAEGSAAASRGSREEQLSRLDRLERDIALERERLGRPDVRDEAVPDRTEARYGDRPNGGDRRHGDERYADQRNGDQVDAVREVDLPDLESKVTESQREAWTLGYQAGLADSQAGGRTTANPFHPLRESRV